MSAQDCNEILACSAGVQISLEGDCTVMISPDMVMETLAYSADAYDVSAKLPDGTPMPEVVIGTDVFGRPIKRVVANVLQINQKLEVTVSLRGCGNRCWGYATIEDKLPPVLV
ncbi:MAG TPA: hypothetical protein PK611_02235, partial [Saprospiraceae bacterium]|nr:hypothetical protein [Saprospiraceae bacterium]